MRTCLRASCRDDPPAALMAALPANLQERFQLLGEDGLVQAEYRDGLLVQQEGRQAAGLQPAQQVTQRSGSRGSGECNHRAIKVAALGQKLSGQAQAASTASAAAAASGLWRLRQQPAAVAAPTASTARGQNRRASKRLRQPTAKLQQQPAAKKYR